MTEISYLIIASLCCSGIYLTMQEGYVLFPLRKMLDRWFNSRWGVYLGKPLYQCLPCMASIHGTWLWFALPTDLPFIVFIFALCILNYVADLLIPVD